MNNVPWTPIGFIYNEAPTGGAIDDVAFKGVFDGDGHTVSNVKITRESAYVSSARKSLGFFGGIGGNGILRNLGLENVTIDLTDSYKNQITGIGCLAGIVYTGVKSNTSMERESVLVENCFATDSKITIKNNHANNGTGDLSYGGIAPVVGDMKEYTGTVQNCFSRNFEVDSSGKTADDGFYVAGLIGRVNSSYIEVYNCYSDGVKSTVGSDSCSEPNGSAALCYGWKISDKCSNLYTTNSTLNVGKGGTKVVTDTELKAMTSDCTALASVFDTSKYGLNGGYPIIKSLKIFDYDVRDGNAVLSAKGTFTNEKLILALYNKDTGRYVNSVVANPSEGALSATMDLSKIKTGEYTVKGFLWTADNAPLENVYENTLTK